MLDVKLEKFEGPLDLLLTLIEKNKIDIYDIPIAEITDQYLEIVEKMGRDNLETASEFMVMAATLIDIKCRMLLPEPENDEEQEDPRSELVRALLEYKEFRYTAGLLRECADAAGESAVRKQDLPREVLSYRPPVEPEDLLSGVTMTRLEEIFHQVLERKQETIDPQRSSFGTIVRESVTLPDQLDYVENFAKKNRRFSFRKLLSDQPTKMRTIVTFLAVLELMKAGKIRISQEERFGDIEIESQEDTDGQSEIE